MAFRPGLPSPLRWWRGGGTLCEALRRGSGGMEGGDGRSPALLFSGIAVDRTWVAGVLARAHGFRDAAEA